MRDKRAPVALDAAIEQFLAHQRTFGRNYRTAEYILRALQRFVARLGASDLSASIFERWCKAQRHLSPTTRYGWQLLVRKLCLFRERNEPGCFVPDPSNFARPQPHPPPVIVTRSQIAALLRAADELAPSPYNPLRPAAIRIAIILLYTAGLRRGEVVRLLLGDIDARHGVLHIRQSKFHKSRWVPLSRDAIRELRCYLRRRLRKPYDLQPSAPLLCNASHCYGHRGWHAYSGASLRQELSTLFERAGVCDANGRRPRVQDMRHSFAVEALSRCYRAGGDVQTHLPKLALYMGHVSIVSTAHYLHFVPEVAALASARFSRRFSHIID
ncbi:MAG: tyrosine-type recombinase/integrase [Betaproteobacteria bacterium]|nr:tyrosine-type recombinase/integrase [Betaproteobacteria bacterium]